MKKVRLEINQFPEERLNEICEAYNISKVSAKILMNRGIDTIDQIEYFLNPRMEYLEETDNYKDVEKACDRLIKAIDSNQKILVYGDYDVDGTTSISQFMIYLNKLGANVDYYVPERESEGYGISQEFLGKIRDLNVELLITVDCGISEVDAIGKITDMGIDTILIDHHQCGEVIPNAYAVINPKQELCESANKLLCASGLTFKFLLHLNRHYKIKDVEDILIEFACLGTIADIVDLVGDNRIITYNGLKRLNETKIVGIKKLIEKAGIVDKKIEAFHIGYIIAPRINAAGRMDTARKAVELFLSKTEEEADKLADELEALNVNRKDIEQDIFNEVVDIIERNFLYKKHVIVVCGNGWHEGVIGIVASRITDKYNKPSIVLSVKDSIAKGSARSLDYLNIFEGLSYCSNLLLRYGGHKLAAGLSLDRNKVEDFSVKINKFADNISEDIIAEKIIPVDSYIDVDCINNDLYKEITIFEPFGHGNPKPSFAVRNFALGEIRRVGKEKQHLSFHIDGNVNSYRVIGFNKIGMLEKLLSNPDSIIVTIDENEYRGVVDLQLVLQDIEDFQYVKHTIDQEKANLIYSLINKTKSKIMKTDIFEFAYNLSKKFRIDFTPKEVYEILKNDGRIECILKNEILYIKK